MTLALDTWTIIGTVLAVGVALATLIMRSTARVDADRRASEARADADRRASEARADADRRASEARADEDRRAFQAEAIADRRQSDAKMDAFRAEMQRLAERQSHVEGALETSRGTAAAD